MSLQHKRKLSRSRVWSTKTRFTNSLNSFLLEFVSIRVQSKSRDGSEVHRYLHRVDRMLVRTASSVVGRPERIIWRIESGRLLIISRSAPFLRFDALFGFDFFMPLVIWLPIALLF
ncbi:hypothetical protein Hanom_Chr04g00353011 [Helianthus anomalus]